MENPVVRKSVRDIVRVFGVHEKVAVRLYTLMDWIYGTNWDKVRIRNKEPITDKPQTLILDKKFNSPSQELTYLMRKYNIEFPRLSKVV